MTPATPIYDIAELAEKADVSRRTVRYYVRRGLLPAPTGTGRGKHYTREHLDTLIRIRQLQESGVPLAEIQARLHGEPRSSRPRGSVPVHAPGPPMSSWTRITLSPGVELHVSRDRRLDEIALQRIARVLEQLSSEP